MIRFLPFELGHLDFFTPREDYPNLWENMSANLLDKRMDLVTVAKGLDIICIAGCLELKPKCGEVFLFVDKRMYDNRKEFVRSVKKLIEDYMVGERGFKRLQMSLDTTKPERKKWAQILQFEYEGTMQKWHNDKDYYLYGRVWQ